MIETGIRARRDQLAPVLFTATIFLSAALLFFVQPMFARIVLPEIGGAPAVWTVAMLFFQSVLILGYLYAHLVSTHLPVRAQVALHAVLWAVALFFLPPTIPENWQLDGSGNIAVQTLALFALGIGAPFALLSANAPLIQSWYSRTAGAQSDDPYFLYAASNLGSFIALLAFPLLAEPFLGASRTALAFAVAFFVLGPFLMLTGISAIRGATTGAAGILAAAKVEDERVTSDQWAFWGLLAFIPSSLMLGVTAKISTDIGALPLIWVVPLSLYLLSFVVTFSERTPFRGALLSRAGALAIIVCALVYLNWLGSHMGLAELVLLVASFFVVAIWAHRTLYEARPGVGGLTKFYLAMSLGGAAGGFLNSIVAPALFNGLYEGLITLVTAMVVVYRRRLNMPMIEIAKVVVLGVVFGIALRVIPPQESSGQLWPLAAIVLFTLMSLILFRKNITDAFMLIAIMLIFPRAFPVEDHIFNDRSFFGLHQVSDGSVHRSYTNGTTLHGAQSIAELRSERPTPLSYYHPLGPLGQLMATERARAARSIGVVGLGVGSLACYAGDGQDWEFYEIDSMVDRVARDETLFTFLSACTPDAPTHLGDARVVLQQQGNKKFDVLVIDAYSSDSVPVHLTTREALTLYFERLRPDGFVAFHVSNRYYNLVAPLGRIADTIDKQAWVQQQREIEADGSDGWVPSTVVIMANSADDVEEIVSDPRWVLVDAGPGPVWTDDYANPLSALNIFD